MIGPAARPRACAPDPSATSAVASDAATATLRSRLTFHPPFLDSSGPDDPDARTIVNPGYRSCKRETSMLKRICDGRQALWHPPRDETDRGPPRRRHARVNRGGGGDRATRAPAGDDAA